MTVQQTTDVLIVGGGAVGMSLAIGLAKRHKQVLLIDIKPASQPEQRQQKLSRRDARVYALNLGSIELLQGLGVYECIQRKADYHKMHVWQGDGVGLLQFEEPTAVPKLLGTMVEPSVLDEALWQAVEQDDDCRQYLSVWQGSRIKDCHHQSDGVLAMIERDGQICQVFARLLVGADGRGSMVRELSAIDVKVLDYAQTAICCAIKTERPHANTARQAMLSTGTLALLPLADLTAGDDGCWQSVVWTLPTPIAKEYLSLPPNILAEKLAMASGFELGRIDGIESIVSFGLSAQVAKCYTAHHTLLVGDAAHGVHPLAGQGLNLGLLDVKAVLTLFEQNDKDALQDVPALLADYHKKRRTHNALMMHGFSLINYAFAGRWFQKEPLRFLRAEAVRLTGKSRRLMAFFNRQASGL